MTQRLSALTHELAQRALGGEHGRSMQPANFNLADAGDLSGLSNDQRYAAVARSDRQPGAFANRALGEKVVGSATLQEARRHMVPVLGISSTSHTTIGFEHALKVGYRGLRAQIEERLGRGGLDARGEDCLQAMLACLEAAAAWHQRHTALLQERMAASEGEVRQSYAQVLSALANVPENPPSTFHEALQALWFMFAFQRLCGNWPGIGRIDQMLGPYLEADLASGRISLDEARELLAHFWIKGCEWIDGQPNIGSGDAQYYQNVVLAGVDAQGREVINAVTYLVLDVVEELGISDFPIAVRISPRTPEKLLRRIAEVQRLGGGTVAVYNEDMVIRALVHFGYALEEARSFANDGCWEVLVPGRTHFSYVPFDMLRLLQETLGVTTCEPPQEFASFEALYQAFLDKLAGQLQKFHQAADADALNGFAAPLISIFVEDCIERGRGYHDRGAHYTVLSPHAGGLPDTANALYAIQKLVYEEGMALGELVEILRGNWAGHETLRQRIRGRLAFFGNDNAEADGMVRRVFDDYVVLVMQVPERSGVLRPPGLSTFGRQIEWAPQRGATAAGTWRGEFLANNFSPAPGSDKAGPTAVIKSFCAVDFEKLPNGTALELKIHPSALKGEAGLEALVALLKTFVALNGWFMHIDVIDSEQLRLAQLHPEQYANLAVRVSGWSARFVTLDRDWQDMVIARTQQEFR